MAEGNEPVDGSRRLRRLPPAAEPTRPEVAESAARDAEEPAGSDVTETVEIRRHEPLRDDVTRAIPRWDPVHDNATVPISRGAAFERQTTAETAHPLPAGRPVPPAAEPPVTSTPSAPAARVGAPAPADDGRADHTSATSTDDSSDGTTDAPATDEDDGPQHSRVYVLLRELLIVAVIAMTLSLVVKTFLMQPFWIPSGSMNSTLIRGDRVVVSKLTPGPFDLKRGDVVVFKDPDHWLEEAPPEPGPLLRGLEFVGLYPAGDNHLIKRVIGLPGDHIVCCDKSKRLTVNGVAIDEPYVYDGDPPSEARFDVRVPDGRVWVMGDHRSDSSDSRFHDDGTGATGSVPVKAITGRAVAVVWPVGRMEWLSDYPTTFDKVPNP